MARTLFLLALAGALGTLTRYGLATLVRPSAGAGFPLGTLAVNVGGCFVAGLLWTLLDQRWPASAETRTVIFVGFLGAFTTFSAFILDTGELFRSQQWLLAAGNLALQNGLGILALLAGVLAGRVS